MPLGVHVAVDMRGLRRAMKAAGVDLDDLKQANARAAAYIAPVAARRAPRQTGRLASTLRGNRAAGAAVVRAGGARTPYAGPIHWGWPARGIEENPFIVDAARDTEPAWIDFYQEDLQKILDKVAAAGVDF